MTYQQNLIFENIHFLKQGISLLQNISDELYSNNDHPYFTSGAGKHMRHILDHYLSFLAGSSGKIDYDARTRDPRLESERMYAIARMKDIIRGLELQMTLSAENDGFVSVHSNEGGACSDISPWCDSTPARELQYLVSHTVHHYALIAMILRIQGYEPPETFGVAPSTLQYQAALALEKQSQTARHN